MPPYNHGRLMPLRRGHGRFRRRGAHPACDHGAAMPLSLVSPDETVELVEIRGGKNLRRRLADLGLNVGERVRVVQNGFVGPMVVAVKVDTRLALGRGEAHHILVTGHRQNGNTSDIAPE